MAVAKKYLLFPSFAWVLVLWAEIYLEVVSGEFMMLELMPWLSLLALSISMVFCPWPPSLSLSFLQPLVVDLYLGWDVDVGFEFVHDIDLAFAISLCSCSFTDRGGQIRWSPFCRRLGTAWPRQ